MEYLENPELEELAALLCKVVLGSTYIATKLEAFTSSNLGFKKHSKASNKRKETASNGEEKIKIEDFLGASTVFQGSYLQGDFLKALPEDQSLIIDTENLLNTSVRSSKEFQDLKRVRSNSYSVTGEPQRSSFFPNSIIRKPSRRRTSSLGDLSEPSSKALFMTFIFALNESFPDYDFNYIKIEQFKDEHVGNVIKKVNNYLAEVTLRIPNVLNKLWSVIDDIINLKGCEVFAFTPDIDNDENDASLWAFHYFFFNKEISRLVYFSCAAKRLNLQ
jgi:hypothetical protein